MALSESYCVKYTSVGDSSMAKTLSTVEYVHDCSGLYPVIPFRALREGNRARQREQVRAFITSWGFTGDTHMHTLRDTHTHTAQG